MSADESMHEVTFRVHGALLVVKLPCFGLKSKDLGPPRPGYSYPLCRLKVLDSMNWRFNCSSTVFLWPTTVPLRVPNGLLSHTKGTIIDQSVAQWVQPGIRLWIDELCGL
jgi:hypothetical protein